MTSKYAPEWETVWEGDDYDIAIQKAVNADDRGIRIHRFVANQGRSGGVALIRDHQHADTPVLLVRNTRHAVGNMHSWELPRGASDPADSSPVETAAREAAEETGYRVIAAEQIGLIHPDTGMLANPTCVTAVVVDTTVPRNVTDGETDDQGWFTDAEVTDMILAGQIRCGVTLAAFHLEAVTAAPRVTVEPRRRHNNSRRREPAPVVA